MDRLGTYMDALCVLARRSDPNRVVLIERNKCPVNSTGSRQESGCRFRHKSHRLLQKASVRTLSPNTSHPVYPLWYRPKRPTPAWVPVRSR